MKMEEWKPQMTQRNTDVFSSGLICENLRHLWLNNSLFLGAGEALSTRLKRLGV
jgi:hypothetical protein